MKKLRTRTSTPTPTKKRAPQCAHNLTDQEAICYIQNNKLGYKLTGNDLNKALSHWKNVGCDQNLSYVCPPDPQIQQELELTKNQLTDISADYKQYVDTTDEKVKEILKMEISDLPFVIKHVKEQNNKLADQLQEDQGNVLTHGQMATFNGGKVRSLDYFNGCYWWVYWIAVFVFGIVLLGTKPDMSIKGKAVLVGLFCVYPWIIGYVELGLWYIWSYLKSFVYGTVF